MKSQLRPDDDGVKTVGAIALSYIDHWELADYGQRYGVQTVNLTTLDRH
jgi:hypothetical protein